MKTRIKQPTSPALPRTPCCAFFRVVGSMTPLGVPVYRPQRKRWWGWQPLHMSDGLPAVMFEADDAWKFIFRYNANVDASADEKTPTKKTNV